MWSTARSEALDIGLPVPIEIRTIRSARRLRLRFDDAKGTLKLTCPPRVSRQAALEWALDQRDWVEVQLARITPPEPLAPGAVIPLEGADVRILWSANYARTPTLAAGELRCGGPEQTVPARVEKFLRARALARMSEDIAEFASKANLTVRSVSVGDASSRWGSCTSEGRIRMSWRLIFAPPGVRRYVAAHEVAHLRHLHHGPEFKAFEAQLFGPGIAEAKGLLRRLGPRLRRIGRRR
jgi:predicted metal-dependent hydrolase